MRNRTFMLLSGADIREEQQVKIDERTRRVVPAEDRDSAIGRAIVGAAAGRMIEIAPLPPQTRGGETADFGSEAFLTRLRQLAALEIEHAGRLN